MAKREILTQSFLPDQTTIIAQEMARLFEANERNARKVDAWWAQPRNTPGAPLPKQDAIRDTYFAHAALKPNVLQTMYEYGSIRSGKTDGVIARDTELMARYPGTRALGVRFKVEELYNSLIASILKFYARIGWVEASSKRLNDGDFFLLRGDAPEITLFNGSKWILRSAYKANSSGEGKADSLGGSEYAIALLEEANELEKWYYDTVLGRMSQRHLPAPIVDVIANPPPESHWLFETFIERTPPNHHSFHFPLEDNRINLGDDYVDDVKERYEGSPTLYKKFYLGLHTPTIVGKPIFGGVFNRQIHVSKAPLKWDPSLPIWRCWDFGFLKPAVVLFQDHPNGQIRVLRSILGKEELIATFGRRMKHRLEQSFPGAKWRDVADIAGKRRSDTSPKSSLESLEAVLGTSITTKYTKVEYGLDIIEEQLTTMIGKGEPAILLCCGGAAHTADGFEFGYCQDPDAKKDELKPCRDNEFEHDMDAFRYGVIQVRTLTTRRTKYNKENRRWRSSDHGMWKEGWSPPEKKDTYWSAGFGKRKDR